MKPLRHALVLLTATAATLAPTAAFAQTYTHADGKGDVVSATPDGSSVTPDPTRAEGDVLSSTVAHQAHKVVVTVRYAQLSRTTQITEQIVVFRTSSGKVRELQLEAGPNHWRGKAQQVTGQGKRWRCATRHFIDYDHDQMTVSVPRRCLGNPRWVKVGIGTLTAQNQKFYADDAQSATIANDIVYGPKVFRG